MRPALFVVAALGLAACTGSLEHEVGDAGPTAPRYDPLDEDEATLALALSNDGQTARVDLRLQNANLQPVTLQDGQVVQVNGQALVAVDAGWYGGTVAAADSYAVKVDEPRHGVLTTTYAAPDDFQISSPVVDLAGTTLTWGPALPAAQVQIALQQTGADGPRQALFSQASDTGTQALTDLDLRQFVQGFDLTVTVTRTQPGAALQGVAQSRATLTRARTLTTNPTSSH